MVNINSTNNVSNNSYMACGIVYIDHFAKADTDNNGKLSYQEVIDYNKSLSGPFYNSLNDYSLPQASYLFTKLSDSNTYNKVAYLNADPNSDPNQIELDDLHILNSLDDPITAIQDYIDDADFVELNSGSKHYTKDIAYGLFWGWKEVQ